MNWSLPGNLVDWSQVVSAILALVALVIALRVSYTSKRALAAERRAAHELEVLRGLSSLIEQKGLGVVEPVRSHLLLLPDSDDLPMLRAALNGRPSLDATSSLESAYPGLAGRTSAEWQEFSPLRRQYEYFKLLRADHTSRQELDGAIERRLVR